MRKKQDISKQIGGVVINGTQMKQVLREISTQRKKMYHVVTVNPEMVMQAQSNPKFLKILSLADLKVADGYGVVWGLFCLGQGWIDRISGVEIVDEVLRLSQDQGKKIFLLGGNVGVADKAAQAMKKVYPGLKVVSYQGSANIGQETRQERGLTLAKIRAYDPDFLLVAYGAPEQDIWIEDNREQLKGMVAMGVGGTLDEWAGVVRRSPKWVDKVGMKWLWRLINEPWRWKRQTRLIKFMGLVMREKMKRMFR